MGRSLHITVPSKGKEIHPLIYGTLILCLNSRNGTCHKTDFANKPTTMTYLGKQKMYSAMEHELLEIFVGTYKTLLVHVTPE